MVSPSKRRKLNASSGPPPTPSRNLDFFFRKPTPKLATRQSNKGEQDAEGQNDKSELTDEQLARKLQAEWDQEGSGDSGAGQTSGTNGMLSSSAQPDESATFQSSNEAYLNSAVMDAYKSTGLDSTPQVPREGPKGESTLSLQSTSSTEDTITSNIPFDESPLTFEPSKYIASLRDHWAADGGNASYALLNRCFVLVNNTQSRIKIVDTLVNLLRLIIEGDPTSLLPTVRTIYHFAIFLRHILVSKKC